MVILVRQIAYSLTDTVQRPLEEVYHLCHSRSYTTRECLLIANLRTMLLVDTVLVPLSIHQRFQFWTCGCRPATDGHTFDSSFVSRHVLQRLGHLSIVVEEPAYIVRSLFKVQVAVFGISQHLGHQVVSGNNDKAVVLLGVKHVVGTVCRTLCTAGLLLFELLARHELLGLPECLFFSQSFRINGYAPYQGNKHQ